MSKKFITSLQGLYVLEKEEVQHEWSLKRIGDPCLFVGPQDDDPNSISRLYSTIYPAPENGFECNLDLLLKSLPSLIAARVIVDNECDLNIIVDKMNEVIEGKISLGWGDLTLYEMGLKRPIVLPADIEDAQLFFLASGNTEYDKEAFEKAQQW